MNITLDKLVQLDACQEAIAWFKTEFPNGIEHLTPEMLALCERNDWICWLACKVSENYGYWCAGIAFREASQVHPSLQSFAMNVTPRNWRAAYAAAAAHAADAAAVSAAAYAAAHAAADAAYAAAYAAAHAAAHAAAVHAAADAAYHFADAAADAAAYVAHAAAARKKVYSELRQEAERILCAL